MARFTLPPPEIADCGIEFVREFGLQAVFFPYQAPFPPFIARFLTNSLTNYNADGNRKLCKHYLSSGFFPGVGFE
jgi:hypothetical protein